MCFSGIKGDHFLLSSLHLCLCAFRTLDDSVYKIARSLAKRYGVPLWEVYMTHLEFLFTDSGYMHKLMDTHLYKHHHLHFIQRACFAQCFIR